MWLLKQRIQGIEVSIESLKVQLTNDTISPRLAATKVLIQSILSSLSPHRSYKKKTASLAQQAVHVAVKISALIETTNELPQLVRHCLTQFEEILRDVLFFVQVETQSSTLYRLLCGKIISARYVVLEERLGILLVHFEQYIVDLRGAGQSRIPSLRSVDTGGAVPPGGDIFSNAHNFTVKGGNYYSGLNLIQQPSHQESGIVQGMRVIPFEDISVAHEILKGRGYRLHSDTTSGKARVVKVYQGPLAKEQCLEAAKFYKTVMHPSFLHMIGVSSINSEVPFLVFNGEFEGTLEASITAALKKDLRNSLMLGLQTVIGISSGLEYLRDLNYHFISAGLQHFGILLSLEGRVIISFDPYIVRAKIGEDGHEEQGSSFELDKPLFIFHGLCKQTFDAACQTHYDGQNIERVYDDILEEDEGRFEDMDVNSSFENRDSSNLASSASPRYQTILDSDAPSMQTSGKSSPRKLPSNGHRRELVWKPESAQKSSLKDILHEFKTFLDGLSTSSGLELYRRRGRYTARTAHRCPGYNRTEITLTPNINRSAIVSHSTPLPREICPVCKQVVKDAEIFNCICGGEDDESVPTIQCSTCYDWHHRPCVAGSNFMDHFTCPDCGSVISEESPESEVADLPKLLPNPTPKKAYSDPNTSTHFATPPSELRRPQTSPRSPLASVRNIVALWKERTSAGVAESVSSVSSSAGKDDLQGIRRGVEDTHARLRETQAVSNPLATPATPMDSPRNSTFPPAIHISELHRYSHSSDPPIHIGILWYLNVHASPYRWQRCHAFLYPHMLLLSWLVPSGGRGIATLDLLNCTNAQTVYSPSHPFARGDAGTIAAMQQMNGRDGQSLMDMPMFQMLYADGVERLAAESLLERYKWLNRIMDSMHSLIVEYPSDSSTESFRPLLSTIYSGSESSLPSAVS